MALCFGCKEIKEIAHTDELTQQQYCGDCVAILPTPNTVLAREYLFATIPYKMGDKVECRTAGVIYDGVGHVTDVSMDLENGGTPVYPSFKVVLDKKAHDAAPDDAWYTEVCLTKADS